tara:strand:- start:1514 stop:1936 length:423 start_codon:yes stop_codon:yes gene_type:complete
MIKYQLKCLKCENIFDSWFSSSKEFEKLKKMKLISCMKCNSLKIEKSIMSPTILSLNSSKKYNSMKNQKVKSKIKEFQKYIKNNFDYVGENFTYEARSIFYGNKKSKKGIYGNATKKDIQELKEEGIETSAIPWMRDKEN